MKKNLKRLAGVLIIVAAANDVFVMLGGKEEVPVAFGLTLLLCGCAWFIARMA
jgi:hypothetical protein